MTTQLFIDGQWADASSDVTLPVLNPATGKQFADMACASRADVDGAVAAARHLAQTIPRARLQTKSFRGWCCR